MRVDMLVYLVANAVKVNISILSSKQIQITGHKFERVWSYQTNGTETLFHLIIATELFHIDMNPSAPIIRNADKP